MWFVIVLGAEGGAELQSQAGRTIWSSDDDPEFMDELGTGPLDEDDAETVLEYLEDEGYIMETDRVRIECEERPAPEDPDELEDEDEDEPEESEPDEGDDALNTF